MITNAVVLDHWGVVKCDVGIRDGRIVALGKAGNPDIEDGVHPALRIGPSTEILAGEGPILTAGGIDCHVHLICPQIVDEALALGDHDADRRRHRPGRGHEGDDRARRATGTRRAMLGALDEMPGQRAAARQGQHRLGRGAARAGASPAPAASSCTRTGARRPPRSTPACASPTRPASRSRSTPTRSTRPASSSRRSRRSPAGRSTPTTPRARAAATRRTSSASPRTRNVLPSSTNPTRPHTVNTVDEHLDMLMVCHHLNPRVPEDLAFAESRIRATTIAAEDVLHDLGAISMIGSDSQAMGRVGETIIRTWQTAHAMKRVGRAPGDGPADNERARRYVAKYTICPAIAHGIDGEVGSVEVGKLADLVLWDPRFFGVRPHAGDQGRRDRLRADRRRERLDPDAAAGARRARCSAADGRTAAATSLRFVAPLALEAGSPTGSGVRRRLVAVRDTRGSRKADMPNNDALPRSGSTPTPSRSGSTARRSSRRRRRSCRWPSGTSCSDRCGRARSCDQRERAPPSPPVHLGYISSRRGPRFGRQERSVDEVPGALELLRPEPHVGVQGDRRRRVAEGHLHRLHARPGEHQQGRVLALSSRPAPAELTGAPPAPTRDWAAAGPGVTWPRPRRLRQGRCRYG